MRSRNVGLDLRRSRNNDRDRGDRRDRDRDDRRDRDRDDRRERDRRDRDRDDRRDRERRDRDRVSLRGRCAGTSYGCLVKSRCVFACLCVCVLRDVLILRAVVEWRSSSWEARTGGSTAICLLCYFDAVCRFVLQVFSAFCCVRSSDSIGCCGAVVVDVSDGMRNIS